MRLVDRSLVLPEQDDAMARFGMLETSRAFAADALRRRGEHPAAVTDHARWAARLAEQIGAALMNVGLAHGYGGRVERALATAAEVRAAAVAAVTPSALAWADFLEGEFLSDRSPERALPLLEHALRQAREIRSAMTEGIALVSLTNLRARHGNPDQALPAFEDAIRHWQRWDDWTHQRVTLRNLALLLERLGADTHAATLLAALDQHAPAAGADAQHIEAARARLANHLGKQFDAAVGRGQTLDRHDIVQLARRAIADTRA